MRRRRLGWLFVPQGEFFGSDGDVGIFSVREVGGMGVGNAGIFGGGHFGDEESRSSTRAPSNLLGITKDQLFDDSRTGFAHSSETVSSCSFLVGPSAFTRFVDVLLHS